MSKADTWMPLYIADYLRATMHLTRDQHGAYLLLIMACWDRGGTLPNDPAQLAAMARATPSEWKKLSPVLMPFFDVDGEHLVQARVVEEYAKAERLSAARREAGQKGGRPRKQDESKSKAIGFANEKQNETPARVRSLQSPSPSSVDKSTAGLLSSGDHNRDAWTVAMSVLTDQGGLPEPKARMFFGRLLSENGITAAALLPSVVSAMTNGTHDPQAYLTKAARGVATRAAPRERKRVGYV